MKPRDCGPLSLLSLSSLIKLFPLYSSCCLNFFFLLYLYLFSHFCSRASISSFSKIFFWKKKIQDGMQNDILISFFGVLFWTKCLLLVRAFTDSLWFLCVYILFMYFTGIIFILINTEDIKHYTLSITGTLFWYHKRKWWPPLAHFPLFNSQAILTLLVHSCLHVCDKEMFVLSTMHLIKMVRLHHINYIDHHFCQFIYEKVWDIWDFLIFFQTLFLILSEMTILYIYIYILLLLFFCHLPEWEEERMCSLGRNLFWYKQIRLTRSFSSEMITWN